MALANPLKVTLRGEKSIVGIAAFTKSFKYTNV